MSFVLRYVHINDTQVKRREEINLPCHGCMAAYRSKDCYDLKGFIGKPLLLSNRHNSVRSLCNSIDLKKKY